MTVTSADVETVRRFYQALAARDTATLGVLLRPWCCVASAGQEPDRWRPSRLARDQ